MENAQKTAQSSRPRFAELPRYRDTNERHAWGVFGANDELGTLNLLTPERVRQAMGSVRDGAWFSLNWNMEFPNPTFFTREPMEFTHIDLGEIHAGSDDVYSNYYSQSSTQWDALNHVGSLDREMYNGFSEESVHREPYPLGIQNSGRRGIAGRYLLIDVAGLWIHEGAEYDLRDRIDITADDLDRALTLQGSAVDEGDIVMVHTGWTRWYSGATEEVRREIGLSSQRFACTFPGLAPQRATIEWLWDHGASAIVTDTPAVESGPFTVGAYDTFLHHSLIGLMGFTLGEMFYLAELADACRLDGRYEGLFTAAPFNKQGGAGSPGNALALR